MLASTSSFQSVKKIDHIVGLWSSAQTSRLSRKSLVSNSMLEMNVTSQLQLTCQKVIEAALTWVDCGATSGHFMNLKRRTAERKEAKQLSENPCDQLDLTETDFSYMLAGSGALSGAAIAPPTSLVEQDKKPLAAPEDDGPTGIGPKGFGFV